MNYEQMYKATSKQMMNYEQTYISDECLKEDKHNDKQPTTRAITEAARDEIAN